MKICFQMKEIFGLNVPCNLQPIWTCSSNIIRKIYSFPSLYSQYNLLPNGQSFFNIACEVFNIACEVSVTCLLLLIMLKKDNEAFSLRKQKTCLGITNGRSRNVRMAPKRYWNCKQPRFEARNRMRFISHFSLELHKESWK